MQSIQYQRKEKNKVKHSIKWQRQKLSEKQSKSKRSETKNKENRKQLHTVAVNSSVPIVTLNV